MRNNILKSIHDCVDAVSKLASPEALEFIEDGAKMVADCFRLNGKVLVAGNGGSLCDAMHLAEELTGFFRSHRKALAAIALSDPGHITCVSNDLAFEEIFSRGIEALGRKDDVFIGLTTSGNSENMVRAFQKAKAMGLKTMAFLGKGGGKLKGVADLELIIDGFATSDRIQEAHMASIHVMIEMIEQELFSNTKALCT